MIRLSPPWSFVGSLVHYWEKGGISDENNDDITDAFGSIFTEHLLQDYTRWSLPDGAVVRFGKGDLREFLYYSPDGTRLAVVISIGIWLYDTETYRTIALLAGHTDRIISVAFSPDSATVAGEGDDKTMRFWDAETGEHKGTFSGHTPWASGLVFSPDGRTLASGSSDGTVLLWKVD